MTKKAQPLEIHELIQFLRQELSDLPDKRKPGNNTKYEPKDAVMAAFSIFFTQSPSFLEHQRLMKNLKGQDNALSLFNINKIPCDNQIRNLLDPLTPSTIYPVFQKVFKCLKKQEVIKKLIYLDGEILIALDGTEYFSSKKINCPHCNCRHHRNGTTTYFHACVIPVVVSPTVSQPRRFTAGSLTWFQPILMNDRQKPGVLQTVHGSDIYGDKGFIGKQWQSEVTSSTGNRIWTIQRENQHQQFSCDLKCLISRVRQRIEGVFHEIQNTGRNPERLLNKTVDGLATHIAIKITSHTLRLFLRDRFGINVLTFQSCSIY